MPICSSRAVQPGQPLVEQQQLRLERQRAGKLQPLLVDIGQLPGRNIGARAKPDAIEEGTRAFSRRRSPQRLVAEGEPGDDVLEAGEVFEHAHQLEGARDAEPGDVVGGSPAIGYPRKRISPLSGRSARRSG